MKNLIFLLGPTYFQLNVNLLLYHHKTTPYACFFRSSLKTLKTLYLTSAKFLLIIIFLEMIEIFSYLLQTLSFKSVFLFIPSHWLGIIYTTISKIFLEKNFFALILKKIWFKLVWTINVIEEIFFFNFIYEGMTYDITKHSPKKHFLQKCDFLFVWNAKFNYL